MTNTRALRNLTLAGAALVCAGAIAHRAVFANAMPARPTTLATVVLPTVLDGLAQRADAEAELRKLADEVREERDRRDAELEALSTQLEDTVDADEREAIEEQIALTGLRYQAWIRFTGDRLDVERSLLLQSLYRSVKEAIESMSEAEGYDLVVIDDSRGELGVNPEAQVSREAQIRQQMAARRVLYSSSTLDITDDLIARMNNAYLAGNAGP